MDEVSRRAPGVQHARLRTETELLQESASFLVLFSLGEIIAVLAVIEVSGGIDRFEIALGGSLPHLNETAALASFYGPSAKLVEQLRPRVRAQTASHGGSRLTPEGPCDQLLRIRDG